MADQVVLEVEVEAEAVMSRPSVWRKRHPPFHQCQNHKEKMNCNEMFKTAKGETDKCQQLTNKHTANRASACALIYKHTVIDC